jgi:hypothetical protein
MLLVGPDRMKTEDENDATAILLTIGWNTMAKENHDELGVLDLDMGRHHMAALLKTCYNILKAIYRIFHTFNSKKRS